MDEQPVFRGRQWRPKNQAQSRCWDVISNHSVVFILGPAGTAMAGLGRWSLSFYMLHQPVFIGGILAGRWLGWW